MRYVCISKDVRLDDKKCLSSFNFKMFFCRYLTILKLYYLFATLKLWVIPSIENFENMIHG